MTAQSTAAAERSAHVTRGPAQSPAACPVVEVAPGVWKLRRVAELERALLDVIEAADAGCPPAVIARPARRAMAGEG